MQYPATAFLVVSPPVGEAGMLLDAEVGCSVWREQESEGMASFGWSEGAAWVQAIGSVLAIIVAVVVGNLTARHSRNLVESERKRQADITASMMSTRFHLLMVEIEEKRMRAAKIKTDSITAESTSVERLTKLLSLTQHESAIRMHGNAMTFDRDTGILITRALDTVEGYNPWALDAIDDLDFQGHTAANVHGLCDAIVSRLQELSRVCSEAEKKLASVHGLDNTNSVSGRTSLGVDKGRTLIPQQKPKRKKPASDKAA